MSYHFDSYDQAIVLDGFEKGIAESPYFGISNLQNVNIQSIPGEASVGFSTKPISATSVVTAHVTSASGSVITIDTPTNAGNTLLLESGMAITFTAISGITGITTGTTYWIRNMTNTTFNLYLDYTGINAANMTNGTGTFVTYIMGGTSMGVTGGINHIVKGQSNNYAIDAVGQVWSDTITTATNKYWTFVGNPVSSTTSSGAGLLSISSSGANPTEFVLAFRSGSIDYLKLVTASSLWTWVESWNPTTGLSAAGYSYLNSSTNTFSHETLQAPDGRNYWCDASYIDVLYENPGQLLSLSSTLTFTYNQFQLMPNSDKAQCLTFLGSNLLIGGRKNVVYSWDRFLTTATPILIPENITAKMVSVNNNAYLFVGNRGRIYVTNGSSAELYKKVPDHLSGTVEPYYQWGGVATNKKQLYFSFLMADNAGNRINKTGGIWAIDLETDAIRQINVLSWDGSLSYAGYATALFAPVQSVPLGTTFATEPAGTGLIAGWYDGTSVWGMDQTQSIPYTNSQANIEFDLIPIGTFEKPRDMQRIEYKLTKPLVSGESIQLNYRTDFSQAYTTIFTDTSTTGSFSSSAAINFKNAQWLQIQAILNTTATNPSYTRLKEVRVTGLVGPSV